MSTIDLNAPPPKHKFSVSVEREETTGERGVRFVQGCGDFSCSSCVCHSDCVAVLHNLGIVGRDRRREKMGYVGAVGLRRRHHWLFSSEVIGAFGAKILAQAATFMAALAHTADIPFPTVFESAPAVLS